MHKNAMKCNKTKSKWCINKHGASKIIDTFETYQLSTASATTIATAVASAALEEEERVGEQECRPRPEKAVVEVYRGSSYGQTMLLP
jgi:hypothetical protein